MSDSKCRGGETLSTKVDNETLKEIDAIARKNGISRAELLRRLIDLYRDSRRGAFRCPDCTSRIRMRP